MSRKGCHFLRRNCQREDLRDLKKGIEEVKDRGFYDETDLQKIKDLRRDTEETTDRFKEIITFLESVYTGKGKKKEKESEEID